MANPNPRQRPSYTPYRKRLMARKAVRDQVLHGVSLNKTAFDLGVHPTSMQKWVNLLPQWEEELGRRHLHRSVDSRNRLMKRAVKDLAAGYSLLETAKRINVPQQTLYDWVDQAQKALCKEPTDAEVYPRAGYATPPVVPHPENVRQPKGMRLARPRSPADNRQANLAQKLLAELPDVHGSERWFQRQGKSPFRRAIRAYEKEMLADYDKLTAGQKRTLRRAAHLEGLADRALAKVDEMLMYEIAGYEGAGNALYDWMQFYATIAKEIDRHFNTVGVRRAPVETPSEPGGRASRPAVGAVRIPDA